jgi:hypothetical protein
MEENMKRIFLIAIIFIIFLAPQAQASTTITFAWDASEGAAGYHVYKSPTNTFTQQSQKVCTSVTALTCTVPNIPDGLMWYAATAYDSAGNESGFSTPVSFNGDTTPPSVPGAFRISLTVNVTINP